MKRRHNVNSNPVKAFNGWNLNLISTIILIFLMFLYMCMTLSGSTKLAEQTDIISNHPFEVVISSGDLKTCISEMRLGTERLLLHHGQEDVKIVNGSLEALYKSIGEPLSRIEQLYLGDKEDVSRLTASLRQLQSEQDAFMDYVASPERTDSEIEQRHTDLYPLYEAVIQNADQIIGVAQERKISYGKTADSLRAGMLTGSAVLMSLMVGGLLLAQYVLRRQQKELVYRTQMFDSLSDSIDDTFIIQDAKTGEVYYTALNMERTLGVPPLQKDALYQGITEADAEEINAAVSDPQFVSPYEKTLEYVRPNGEKRWLSLRIYRTEDMDEPQLIFLFSDRTNEIKSRRALQDAILNAERANTAKSDFLSRMSHEIRTPLNAIIGMTAIAAASVNDPPRVEDCLSKINFSSKHLLMLINDILDMSKIESNKMSLLNEPFDILQIINGFVSTIYPQTKSKGISFDEAVSGFDKHTTYIGDSLRLNQILLNLGSNAVKFTPPSGKVHLEVTLIASKNTVDILRFTLSDTGIGMTEEAIERIFQPFEQADASISGRFGGTGLGMSITRNLVTLMNGQIQIKSQPNKGTACIVEIPLKRACAVTEGPDFSNMGLKALIVDDEQAVCEQVSSLLDTIKIRSEWVQSGREAINLIKEAHRSNRDYDICLIDWKMPDIDGIEATRRIRALVGPDIPIIIISAYDTTEIECEARDAGADGFLPKPLYRSSVYEAIKAALENKHGPSTARKQEAQHAAADSGDAASRPLGGKRLLIAEDNELNREIARELLRMNGALVECVENGQEATARFCESESGYYDAVLMDVRMPVMNGYEAAKKIRVSDHPDAQSIPIIATTANAFSDDISAALASGMNAHISKPLDMEHLCEVLAKFI